MADTNNDSERVLIRLDRAAQALDRIAKHEDRKQREPMTPHQRETLIQADKAATAAKKASELAGRVSPEHLGTAMRAAEAGKSLYQLARHGSFTGGIADLAGAGLNALGMNRAGAASRRIGSAMAIAEVAGGNLLAAPRAIEGIPDAIRAMKYTPVAAPYWAAKAAGAVGRSVGNLADYYSRPSGNGGVFSEGKAALAAERGEEQLLHASRSMHHMARGAGGVAGGVGGALLGGAALGPLGFLAGGYLGSKAGKVGGGLAYGAVAPAEWAIKASSKLRDFADNLHKTNMQFSEFSGGMQRVAIEQEMREMQQSRKRGEALAPSAGYLAEGKAELDKPMANVETAVSAAKNLAGGWLARQGAKFINPFGLTDRAATAATNAINSVTPGGDAPARDPFREPLQVYGRPARFN